MDMLEFIKSRRSTRKYQDRAVEPEKIAQIIEAGCYAPSGGNNQTWHFTVIQDKALLARLAELARENNLNYCIDIYPYYSSDVSAALRGGQDIQGGLLGPGVFASHAYERSSVEAVENTMKLLIAYIQD